MQLCSTGQIRFGDLWKLLSSFAIRKFDSSMLPETPSNPRTYPRDTLTSKALTAHHPNKSMRTTSQSKCPHNPQLRLIMVGKMCLSNPNKQYGDASSYAADIPSSSSLMCSSGQHHAAYAQASRASAGQRHHYFLGQSCTQPQGSTSPADGFELGPTGSPCIQSGGGVSVSSSASYVPTPPSAATTTPSTKSKRRRHKPQCPGKTAADRERLFTQHDYHDLSLEPDVLHDHVEVLDETTKNMKEILIDIKHTPHMKEFFPLKLHRILEETDAAGLSHIISWMPHGRVSFFPLFPELLFCIMCIFFAERKF
mgnify:CR=1 FL=1